MFQEFPKGLSKGDEWVVVFNKEEEDMYRTEGYRFAFDEEEASTQKRRPGRPPKATE